MTVDEFLKPKCPVEVGDYFYHGDKIGEMRVTNVEEKHGHYYITGKYVNHVSPLERVFSDVIFDDPEWVIEKKGRAKDEDFY